MTHLETILIRHFDDHYLFTSERNQQLVQMEVLCYLFKLTSNVKMATTLRKLMKLSTTFSIEAFRNEVSNDGYLIKNVKMWLYHSVVSSELAKKLVKPYKVDRVDIPIASLLRGKLLMGLRKYKRDKYKSLSIPTIDTTLIEIIDQVRVFAAKFVYRKMSFIVRANGMEHEDLINDLICKGIQSVHMTYPRIESKEHCLNLVKLTLHNYGINIIHKYSNSKRNRTIKEPDGTFVNTMIPIDVMLGQDMQNPNLCDSTLSWNVTDLEGKKNEGSLLDVNEISELRISINQLLRSINGKRKKFIQLLMGKYDPEFTNYLIDKGLVIDGNTNEDYQEKVRNPHSYLKQVLSYLNVSIDTGEAYLSSLREKFKDYQMASVQ